MRRKEGTAITNNKTQRFGYARVSREEHENSATPTTQSIVLLLLLNTMIQPLSYPWDTSLYADFDNKKSFSVLGSAIRQQLRDRI